jgi:D-3-phosphoglycerate dehydrogenase
VKFVVPDDFPPVYQGHPDLKPLEALGTVEVFHSKAASEDELVQRLAGAVGLINVRAYTVFTRQVLERLPNLYSLSILGTGTDNVDLAAATDLGVVVTNTPGASAVSVAELTLALLLAVARHVPLADRKMRAGEWHHAMGVELRGKTLGVLGLGAIGREVAKMARALGLNVLAWSFSADGGRARECGATLVDQETLLRDSHIISLHLRATPQTRHLIGPSQFALMRPGAILINTGRAALVDTAAMIAALKSGKLAGAGLDVFDQEPLPEDSLLLQMDNVVLSPHVGWVTHEASQRMRQMPVDNILAYLRGEPEHVVNPKAMAHPRQRQRPQW